MALQQTHKVMATHWLDNWLLTKEEAKMPVVTREELEHSAQVGGGGH